MMFKNVYQNQKLPKYLLKHIILVLTPLPRAGHKDHRTNTHYAEPTIPRPTLMRNCDSFPLNKHVNTHGIANRPVNLIRETEPTRFICEKNVANSLFCCGHRVWGWRMASFVKLRCCYHFWKKNDYDKIKVYFIFLVSNLKRKKKQNS